MSLSFELPEHQFFHVLRRGEQEAIGPYSQNQLVELLNDGVICASDYVYYEALDGWKPLSQVFDFDQRITNFADEGQDSHVVEQSFSYVSETCNSGEEIFYIAVQHQPALSLTAAVRLTSPKAVVLTNHRVCLVKSKLLGDSDMQEYPLDQIREGITKVKAGEKSGQFNLVLKTGEWIEINKIPVLQLEKIESLTNAFISGNYEVTSK